MDEIVTIAMNSKRIAKTIAPFLADKYPGFLQNTCGIASFELTQRAVFHLQNGQYDDPDFACEMRTKVSKFIAESEIPTDTWQAIQVLFISMCLCDLRMINTRMPIRQSTKRIHLNALEMMSKLWPEYYDTCPTVAQIVARKSGYMSECCVLLVLYNILVALLVVVIIIK